MGRKQVSRVQAKLRLETVYFGSLKARAWLCPRQLQAQTRQRRDGHTQGRALKCVTWPLRGQRNNYMYCLVTLAFTFIAFNGAKHIIIIIIIIIIIVIRK